MEKYVLKKHKQITNIYSIYIYIYRVALFIKSLYTLAPKSCQVSKPLAIALCPSTGGAWFRSSNFQVPRRMSKAQVSFNVEKSSSPVQAEKNSSPKQKRRVSYMGPGELQISKPSDVCKVLVLICK